VQQEQLSMVAGLAAADVDRLSIGALDLERASTRKAIRAGVCAE